MSRSYKGIRPKANRVYSVEDVRVLYGICRNTLSNWVSGGLRPVDEHHPQLFVGAELIWFHGQRRLANRRELRVGKFKCLSKKLAFFPDPSSLVFETMPSGSRWVRAKCPECEGSHARPVGETEWDLLRQCFETNTSPGLIDEDNGAAPGGIGKEGQQERPNWTPENERLLHAFQQYLTRYDPKTVDAILAAVRHFERFLRRKSFASITKSDVDAWRQQLIMLGRGGSEGRLSRSTITHHASHVRQFLKWLVEQEGYRRLNRTLHDYAILPRSQTARALRPNPRPYPTTAQILAILDAMRTRTRTERRDLAIVAASYLFGTRSDTTASLRLGDVDLRGRRVMVDATKVRVKNSKSGEIAWFPVGRHVEAIVIAWIEEMTALGGMPEDPLFPPDAALQMRSRLLRTGGNPIAPWGTDAGVRRAFHRGSEAAGLRYFNPHSIKHHLKSIRDEFCRTPAQRAAWSYNLGHENERTTEINYAKMTSEQCSTTFVAIRQGNTETEDEKDLLLAYHEHELVPGTPEFERAEALFEARRRRRKPRSQDKELPESANHGTTQQSIPLQHEKRPLSDPDIGTGTGTSPLKVRTSR